jgi:glycerol-3-phosphate dehydrogenase (NAD(P)+)
MKKITVLGVGAMGFAMAKLLAENNPDKELMAFDVNKEYISHIQKTRKHPVFHHGVELPEHVCATCDLKEAVADADLILLAIPSEFMRGAVKQFRSHLTKDVVFLSVAKGLESKTNMTVSEIVAQELKRVKVKYDICALGGGMIAKEVVEENSLGADLGCKDMKVAEKVAKVLRNDYLRVQVTKDVKGVQLAGAFKNVIAIGAGVFDGIGQAESSKAAYVSLASVHVRELAVSLGAKPETFGPGGQAWFGDLMTCCFGGSRNREYGELLGKGLAPKEALETMKKNNKLVEGYITSAVVYKIVKKQKVDAPVFKGIYDLIYNSLEPQGFVKKFVKEW